MTETLTQGQGNNANQSQGSGIGSALGGVLTGMLQDPETQKKILGWLFGAISGLFHKSPKPVPPVVTQPIPNPNHTDPAFPDDVIPAPPSVTTRKVTVVKLGIARVQLNTQRFPNRVREDGTGYLYSDAELEQVRAGAAIPYASKVWLDLTAYDQSGQEFLRDAVVALGLAYNTEHHFGDSFIIGKGADAAGDPKAGYETNDGQFGNGITAWQSSKGFLHQIKAHTEGSFDCWGKVGGVESNHQKLNVS